MTKYAMAIDLNRCVGCHACSVACKAEWELQDDNSRCWVKPVGPEIIDDEIGFTFYTGLCNHCDIPTCVSECPTGATYKKDDGTVVVDKDLCIGCGNCIVACPYNARYNSKIDKKVEKCTFCDERVALGKDPACVETCPTNARIFGNMEDKNSEVFKKIFNEKSYPLSSKQFDIGPNIYYTAKEKDFKLLAKHYIPTESKISPANKSWRMLKPLVTTALSLTTIGVVGAYIGQLFFGEEEGHE